MLIRKTVTQTNPEPPIEHVENNVTIVKPRRPTGLLAGLGIATLMAVGAVMYLSWYLPNSNNAYTATPASVTVTDSRPERFSAPAPKTNTVIINPPAVIQTTPPAQPTVVTPPSPPVVVNPPVNHTVIVPGSSSEPPRSHAQTNGTNSSDGSNNSSNGDDGSTGSDDGSSGDVDGTVVGSGSGSDR